MLSIFGSVKFAFDPRDGERTLNQRCGDNMDGFLWVGTTSAGLCVPLPVGVRAKVAWSRHVGQHASTCDFGPREIS
jgi:hypothetical protein